MEKEKNIPNNVEGKLSEEELNNVSGGAGGCDSKERYSSGVVNSRVQITFVAQVGDEIEIKGDGNKVKALVLVTRTANNGTSHCETLKYWDEYKIRHLDGSNHEGWITRQFIYKK